MTNLTKSLPNLFENFEKHFLDFDRLFSTDYFPKSTNYPPHNIIKRKEGGMDLELAIAGFVPEDVSVDISGNKLTIAGESKGEEAVDEKDYVYRGISTRSFTKTFYVPEHLEVKEATFKDGLLTISFDASKKDDIKRIEIKKA